MKMINTSFKTKVFTEVHINMMLQYVQAECDGIRHSYSQEAESRRL